ncbi:hypothetical protein DY000_02059673 [Brassica cretica]|uniref:Uncharacterized protein n=1 Tax=Brassica cretica TaxID=69181 RepID=A0ABQ7ANR7_BRACR|nr:hypothetical protein DY000_02059673 [Brassica cretica]
MIMEEASVWFLSQSLEQQEEHKEKKDEERIKKRWSKPYQNCLAYKKLKLLVARGWLEIVRVM